MCNRPPVSTHKAVPCCGRCTRSHLSIVGVIPNWSDGLQVFTQISPNAVNIMVWQFKTCLSRLVSLPDRSKCSKCLTEISEGFVIAPTNRSCSDQKDGFYCLLVLLVPPCAISRNFALSGNPTIAMHRNGSNGMDWELFAISTKTFFLTPS